MTSILVHHTSTRAMGSTGKFNPASVPNGYGPLVEEAAANNGLDASILAGLIDTESKWNR